MKRNRGRGNEKYTADAKLFSLQHSVLVNIESNYLITAVLTIHVFRGKDWNMAIILFKQYVSYSGRLWWSRGSVLAISTQVRGFKPGRSVRFLRTKKSSARLPSEEK
jgi:hypothetical protein